MVKRPQLRNCVIRFSPWPGKAAIEKAKTGHPKVYGWMVDYFYKGYESFNIEPGIAMLAPYLDDPNCLTSKKQAIMKRLEGMKTLLPGTIAPDFSFTDDSGNSVNLQGYKTGTPYKLVLFWSADCPHCMELVNKLYTWWIAAWTIKSNFRCFSHQP